MSACPLGEAREAKKQDDESNSPSGNHGWLTSRTKLEKTESATNSEAHDVVPSSNSRNSMERSSNMEGGVDRLQELLSESNQHTEQEVFHPPERKHEQELLPGLYDNVYSMKLINPDGSESTSGDHGKLTKVTKLEKAVNASQISLEESDRMSIDGTMDYEPKSIIYCTAGKDETEGSTQSLPIARGHRQGCALDPLGRQNTFAKFAYNPSASLSAPFFMHNKVRVPPKNVTPTPVSSPVSLRSVNSNSSSSSLSSTSTSMSLPKAKTIHPSSSSPLNSNASDCVLGKRSFTNSGVRGFAYKEENNNNNGQEPDLSTHKYQRLHSRSPTSTAEKVRYYDDLEPLEDYLDTGLDVIFCGVNPGKKSAEIRHHFGNPTNHFWSCLYESGLTPYKLDPSEDRTLTQKFSIGLTNLVSRPTVEQSELSKAEQISGVAALLEKVAKYKPRVLCFVGLGIANIVKEETKAVCRSNSGGLSSESIVRGWTMSKVERAVIPDFGDVNQQSTTKKGKVRRKKSSPQAKEKATIGLQSYKMVHPIPSKQSVTKLKCEEDIRPGQEVMETLFFAVSSTSGRVVKYQKSDKIKQFQDLRILTENLKKGIVDTTSISSIS